MKGELPNELPELLRMKIRAKLLQITPSGKKDTKTCLDEAYNVFAEQRPSAETYPYLVAQRKQLVADRTLIEKDGFLVFTKDVEFSSPSAAAVVIHGGSANGLIAWKPAMENPSNYLTSGPDIALFDADNWPTRSTVTFHPCAILFTETKRLRIDEEYRFSNGTGWRSKNQRNFEVPGPQNGHRVARGAGGNPEPAYCGIDGAFQIAQKRSPFAQRSAADGGPPPAVIGLPAQPQPGTL